jgi:hypothetical protein
MRRLRGRFSHGARMCVRVTLRFLGGEPHCGAKLLILLICLDAADTQAQQKAQHTAPLTADQRNAVRNFIAQVGAFVIFYFKMRLFGATLCYY